MIKLKRLFCCILEKKDDFDWGKYLLEGEEVDLGPNVDTPVSSRSLVIKLQNLPSDMDITGYNWNNSAETGVLFTESKKLGEFLKGHSSVGQGDWVKAVVFKKL